MSTPTRIATYSAANMDAVSLDVPYTVAGDWLVAMMGSAYSDAVMSVSNGGDGNWVPIGSVYGSPNSPEYKNYRVQAWYKVVKEPGTHNVATSSTGDHVALIVHHVRGAVAIDGTPSGQAVKQGNASSAQEVPGITVGTSDALLVGVWGSVQFSGALNYSAPGSMTERAEVSNTDSTRMMSATEVLGTSGATGSRIATTSLVASYGWAAKLFAIRGGVYVPPEPEPEPEVPPPPPAPPVLVTDEKGVDWSFVIGPRTGGLSRELLGATSRKITFKLGAPSEASCTLDGDDPAAAEIVELATDMHVYRSQGRGKRKELLYRGRIGKTTDNLDADGHTVEIPSSDYRELLKRRLLMTGSVGQAGSSTPTWTQKDQAEIAWGLITVAQTRPGGDMGITRGVGQSTGQLRDRTYNLGDSIGDKLQELSEVLNGFEWDITPTSSSAMQLDIWAPQRGSDKAVVLQYGGNIESVTRTVDSSDFANAVRLTGKEPDGGGTEPPPHERPIFPAEVPPRVPPQVWYEPEPIEGRWDKLYQEDITTAAGLADRADWRLNEASTVRPSYTVTLQSGWWEGTNHIWLGDTVQLVIMSGRLRVNTKLRVQEISVDISEDGSESVSMTLGYPKRDFKTLIKGIDARLSKLERR